MAEIVRTFVAVEIPFEVKDRAGRLITQLRASSAKVKWVAPQHLHWTLKFLGDVDMLEIPKVCSAVQKAVEPFAPFDVEARGAGAFPDLLRPRTVWIGMGEGTEAMVALHDAIDAALAPLGFRGENRRFRPHLTIGRVRQSDADGIDELSQLLQAAIDFESGLSTVYEVVVFSSELGPDGPTYEPLSHADLRG